MNKSYSAEFKMEAVKRLDKTGEPMSKFAADLGVKPTTMQGWVNKGTYYRNRLYGICMSSFKNI